jgi:DNA-binding response OmpR family regulator
MSFSRHLQVIRVRVGLEAMQILVIEDEPRILAFLARGLEAEGFRVDGAGNGPDGLKQALACPYDAVVLDLLLPGLDGLAVLRELQDQRPDLPVVIVSARSDLPTKLRGFGLGASDYLAKPFALF